MSEATQNQNQNQPQFPDNKYHVVKNDKKLIEAVKTEIGKVMFNISDYSNGKGEAIKNHVAYVDEKIMGTFAKRILNGGVNLPTKEDTYGNITLYSEQKIHAHKKDTKTGLCPTISIKFIKNGPTMRIPFKIMIEIGEAEALVNPTGGTSIKQGTYKKTSDANFMLSQMDFETIFVEIDKHLYAKAAADETVKLFQAMKKVNSGN